MNRIWDFSTADYITSQIDIRLAVSCQEKISGLFWLLILGLETLTQFWDLQVTDILLICHGFSCYQKLHLTLHSLFLTLLGVDSQFRASIYVNSSLPNFLCYCSMNCSAGSSHGCSFPSPMLTSYHYFQSQHLSPAGAFQQWSLPLKTTSVAPLSLNTLE